MGLKNRLSKMKSFLFDDVDEDDDRKHFKKLSKKENTMRKIARKRNYGMI